MECSVTSVARCLNVDTMGNLFNLGILILIVIATTSIFQQYFHVVYHENEHARECIEHGGSVIEFDTMRAANGSIGGHIVCQFENNSDRLGYREISQRTEMKGYIEGILNTVAISLVSFIIACKVGMLKFS